LVSQYGPPLKGPQSASLTQTTHSELLTSQTVPGWIVRQSVVVAHLGMQTPLFVSHALPLGQSVLDEQPHRVAGPIMRHELPSELPAQSASARHTVHRPVPLSQTPPEGLAAQSLLVVQAWMQVTKAPGGPMPAIEHV
jgi:hypothetical protein